MTTKHKVWRTSGLLVFPGRRTGTSTQPLENPRFVSLPNVLLEWLAAEPLLDLGMRLGEGTGAALAIPLIRMAEGMLNTMANLPGEHPS